MREPYRRQPSVTTILIVANIAFFFLQAIFDNYTKFSLTRHFSLTLDGLLSGRIYQLITFQFLHGGLLHIFFNLLGIYCVGRALEEGLPRANYWKLYLGSGIAGGLFQMGLAMISSRWGGGVVGASAGLYGLIGAFAALCPQGQFQYLFYFIPITVTAQMLLIFSALFALFNIIVTVPGDMAIGAQVAHGAHLGGLIAGWVYIRFIYSGEWSLTRWRRKPAREAEAPRELVRMPSKSFWQQAGTAPKQQDLPPAEFISKEVDPILDKISAHGIQSLTEKERKILEAARSRMAKR
jgi:membrane associated rhomboid family serine protease